MLVEGRAAAEALAAEVVGEQVARDDQHPRPHARPASVVALPGAHDALERGRGEILSSLRSHRIREERVDRGYVAAVDLVQVPQLVVAEPPELRHGGERTLAGEPVSRADDAHRAGATRRATESFERLDAALSGWASVRGRAPVRPPSAAQPARPGTRAPGRRGSQRCSSARPFSGTGTSMASKARGTSVRGKTA